VTAFHIRNGAVFYRLNYLADMSTKGLTQSASMMVNYVYNLQTMQDYATLVDQLYSPQPLVSSSSTTESTTESTAESSTESSSSVWQMPLGQPVKHILQGQFDSITTTTSTVTMDSSHASATTATNTNRASVKKPFSKRRSNSPPKNNKIKNNNSRNNSKEPHHTSPLAAVTQSNSTAPTIPTVTPPTEPVST
jgi:hypothetical protein